MGSPRRPRFLSITADRFEIPCIPAKKQASSPNRGFPLAHFSRLSSTIRVSSVMAIGTEYPMATFLLYLFAVLIWNKRTRMRGHNLNLFPA